MESDEDNDEFLSRALRFTGSLDSDVDTNENALISSEEEQELEEALNNNHHDINNNRNNSNQQTEDDFVNGLSKRIQISNAKEVDEFSDDEIEKDITDYGITDDEDDFNNDDEDDDDDEYVVSDEELDLDSDSFRQNLKAAAGMKYKKSKPKGGKKRYQRILKNLNPEVRMKLSEANEAFVSNKIAEAEKLYMEVLNIDPRNYAALKTLGEIAKMKGKLSHCCVYWILAAQINSWDGDFWAVVGELSISLGHFRQAFYCYSNAIRHDTKDHKYLWERTRLYEERQLFSKALHGYQRLLKFYPDNQQIVIAIAKLLSEMNKVNDAIEMYMNILNQNINYYSLDESARENEVKDFPDFDWSELNILSELFYKDGQYQKGLQTVKNTARWLQGRGDETFWDNKDDDSEFDFRRFENPDFQKLPFDLQSRPYELIVDIKIKLGLFRLRTNNITEAKIHFENLLDESDVGEFEDLYIQVANALEREGEYQEALRYYSGLIDVPALRNSEILKSAGKCLYQLGNFQGATELFKEALSTDPENLDILSSLVYSLFHTGNRKESEKYLREAAKLSKSQKLNRLASETNYQNENDNDEDLDETMFDDNDDDNTALVAELRTKKKSRIRKKTLSEHDKKDMEKTLISDSLEKFNKLKTLEDSVNKGDLIAIQAWLQVAGELIEIFCGVRSFFVRDHKDNILHEVVYIQKKNSKLEVTKTLEKLFKLHDLANSGYAHIDPSFTLEEDKYRGITFNDWFFIFMKNILLTHKYEDREEALELMEIAKTVSYFRSDFQKSYFMSLLKLSIDSMSGDYEGTMASIREILNSVKFSRDAFKLFNLTLPSGRKAFEVFISLNHQKYFLRQVKAWDSYRFKTKISGQANIKDIKDIDASAANPYLVTIYSQVLISGKSYINGLFHLLKLYKEFKQDPMICFMIGIACLHRSMQRLSSNRQMYILQALTYFNEYRELRAKKGSHEAQEVEYNFARMFHQISLTTFAIHYYNRVLNDYKDLDSNYDLKSEAAYNLYLIYNSSGNPKLALETLNKYLTV